MDHISVRMEEGLALDDVSIHKNTLTLRAKLIQPPNFDLEASITDNLQKAGEAEMRPDDWAEVCIYRVPKALRDVNPHAFDPQIVSIGPYHHGKQGLRDMDIHKWRCFRRIIGRPGLDKVSLFKSIREVVSKARRCYEGTIQLSDDEFVETMLLDGCFLLEIFRGYDKGFENLGYSTNDPVFSSGVALEFIRADVNRLENQVPLFILERLLGPVTHKRKNKKDEVIRLALNYLGVKKPIEKYRECVHCLDIYRQSLLVDESTSSPQTSIPQQTSNLDPPNSPPTQQLTIPCVSKLREAGVKFKKRETKEEHGDTHTQGPDFFDINIKFEAGVLHIPMLLLDDNTRRVFPNLIAFEQCHYYSRRKNHVTSYAKFMDDLIDSSDDVAYLHDRGIIDPFGGGSYKETAKFFNNIVNEVFFNPSDSYLSRVTTDLSNVVKGYNESKIRNWTVKIKSMYFSNPWSIISLFAAIFELVLTFLATFYAMYGYYKLTSLIAWLM